MGKLDWAVPDDLPAVRHALEPELTGRQPAAEGSGWFRDSSGDGGAWPRVRVVPCCGEWCEPHSRALRKHSWLLNNTI